jgi:glycosyltransferase involved in cell wall biosynthesis
MKIGLITYHSYRTLQSLTQILMDSASALSRDHELVPYPEGYGYYSRQQQSAALPGWLAQCDVIVGPVDSLVLQARRASGRRIPYICFLLGCLSRGAGILIDAHKNLGDHDYLVGNCLADVELCRALFANGNARCVPFAVDGSKYYREDDATIQRTRRELGIPTDGLVLLYVGRISVEKNLHTVLRVFRAVLAALPQARLVIAGQVVNTPFRGFGVYTLDIKRTLQRIRAGLGLDENSVQFTGPLSQEQLRRAYSSADLAINLTLHHDENFGLAQVEAMACGTPVLGTNWGGLKDTIVEGVSGAKVSTILTASGVKVDWWEAANKAVALLSDAPARARLSRSCQEMAASAYSLERYRENLTVVLDEALRSRNASPEPLRPTPFAESFWRHCTFESDGQPPYRRGAAGAEMYRRLIAPFAGAVDPRPAHEETVLCLAAPVELKEFGAIAVNDPIYPAVLTIPPGLEEAVGQILARAAESPILRPSDALHGCGSDSGSAALVWLVEQGVLLETSARYNAIDWSAVGPEFSQPLLTMQAVASAADVVSIV